MNRLRYFPSSRMKACCCSENIPAEISFSGYTNWPRSIKAEIDLSNHDFPNFPPGKIRYARCVWENESGKFDGKTILHDYAVKPNGVAFNSSDELWQYRFDQLRSSSAIISSIRFHVFGDTMPSVRASSPIVNAMDLLTGQRPAIWHINVLRSGSMPWIFLNPTKGASNHETYWTYSYTNGGANWKIVEGEDGSRRLPGGFGNLTSIYPTLLDGLDLTHCDGLFMVPNIDSHIIHTEHGNRVVHPLEGRLYRGIPIGLFAQNPNIVSVESCFANSKVVAIPADLFSSNKKIRNFRYCFYNCWYLEYAPPLWEIFPHADGTGCFGGPNRIANYAEIPASWK